MLHVLMVDDEPDLDMLIKQRFRRVVKAGDIQLSFARNGLEALDVMASAQQSVQDHTKPVDLIVSDLNMPEMNGMELILKVKATYPDTKIYIASAYGDKDSVQSAKNAGADGFLVKPLDFKELDDIIAGLSA